MKDRWDVIGGAAVVLVGAGVWRLSGWPWAAIFFGALLGVLYILHEMQAARARIARTEGNG